MQFYKPDLISGADLQDELLVPKGQGLDESEVKEYGVCRITFLK